MEDPGGGRTTESGRDRARREYTTRAERLAAERTRLERRSWWFSMARLVTATATAGLFLKVIASAGENPRPWLAALAIAAFTFAILAFAHARLIRRLERTRSREGIQRDALARMDRRWEDLPVPVLEAPEGSEALARDLRLFGRASVAQLLGSARSPVGRKTLARWLVEPASPPEVAERQDSVRALRPLMDLRQELESEGDRLGELAPDVEPFLAWCESEGWLARREGWVWAARLLPAAAWTTALGAALGWLPTTAPIALFTFSFGLANLLAVRVEEEHERVAAREREMGTYASALSLLWSPTADGMDAEILIRLRRGLEANGEPVHRHMQRLQRLMDLADARRSGTLRFVLGTLFVWDVHTLWWLETWRREVGARARGWLERLGELEVLGAFAGLAFEEPEWCFPILEPDRRSLEATDLGHPLLPADARVTNDVRVGPPGRALFVTGSNMSGKSTLLRALGVNAALAQAGAPVCARTLRSPPLAIATSILVEDSLEQGLSFFLAEVLRVREVVTAAEAAGQRGSRVLFLLDEILRGTNSADRRVAVREVLMRLISLGAIGALSTHDLGLAEEPGLRDVLDPVHFREELHPETGPGEPAMTFDYRLRPGVAPTTNAIRLLEMFGLG